MKFIGRQTELAKLNAEYTHDSSFVVIYGRRRVGKTTLIKEFLKEKTAFYFLATEGLESQSMKRLAGVVARTTNNTLLQKATFNDWLDLFQVIADGHHKLGKIAGVLGQETSALTPYLATLTDLGFIEKRTPVTEKNPEKSRKGLYFIADNFIRFWFRYVCPYKGELELDNMQIVMDEMGKDFTTGFLAFVYEDICKNIFANLCKAGAISFVPSRIGSYWLNDYDGDTEIDVMAVDGQNKLVFVGECKYHAKPVDAPVYLALKEKVVNASEIKKAYPGYDVIYGLFSKSGFTLRMLDVAKENAGLILINELTI